VKIITCTSIKIVKRGKTFATDKMIETLQ